MYNGENHIVFQLFLTHVFVGNKPNKCLKLYCLLLLYTILTRSRQEIDVTPGTVHTICVVIFRTVLLVFVKCVIQGSSLHGEPREVRSVRRPPC